MIISFNHLRRLKDSLPDGSMHAIADDLNVHVETVRNFFGGADFENGEAVGLHVEQGPDGGIVKIDNPEIYYKALDILKSETVPEH
jgi:hypothetical protein